MSNEGIRAAYRRSRIHSRCWHLNSPYNVRTPQEVPPMDDLDLHREQILRHVGPIITGRFAGFRASYTRPVRIGQPLVMAVFLASSVFHLIGSLLRMKAGRRSFKELKKGPEFLVTPVRLRDDLGQTYEVEMHGQLPQSALRRGDLVQVTTTPQKDPAL